MGSVVCVLLERPELSVCELGGRCDWRVKICGVELFEEGF